MIRYYFNEFTIFSLLNRLLISTKFKAHLENTKFIANAWVNCHYSDFYWNIDKLRSASRQSINNACHWMQFTMSQVLSDLNYSTFSAILTLTSGVSHWGRCNCLVNISAMALCPSNLQLWYVPKATIFNW